MKVKCMPAENTRDLLQDALLKIRSLRAEVTSLRQVRNEPVAIVGAGCRFPGGACTPDAFGACCAKARTPSETCLLGGGTCRRSAG